MSHSFMPLHNLKKKKSSLFSGLDWGQNDRSVAAGINAPWGCACRISQRIRKYQKVIKNYHK